MIAPAVTLIAAPMLVALAGQFGRSLQHFIIGRIADDRPSASTPPTDRAGGHSKGFPAPTGRQHDEAVGFGHQVAKVGNGALFHASGVSR